MAFAIDQSALHRPLGFTLGEARAAVNDAAWPREVVVERFDRGREGAGAAAILPRHDLADAAGAALREELRRTGGVLGAGQVLELGGEAKVVASARGIVDGHRVSVLGIASGRPVPTERGALRAWLLTDARLAPGPLELLLNEIAARSFATIAGVAEPRPADAIVALASGLAGADDLEPGSIGWRTLLAGSTAVAQAVARRLLEEAFAPAAARLVQVTVTGARSDEEAARLAETLCADPSLRAAIADAKADVELREAAAAAVAPVFARAGVPAPAPRCNASLRGTQAALHVQLGHLDHPGQLAHAASLRSRGDSGTARATATRWTAVAPA